MNLLKMANVLAGQRQPQAVSCTGVSACSQVLKEFSTLPPQLLQIRLGGRDYGIVVNRRVVVGEHIAETDNETGLRDPLIDVRRDPPKHFDGLTDGDELAPTAERTGRVFR
jgi:hypothetical protein